MINKISDIANEVTKDNLRQIGLLEGEIGKILFLSEYLNFQEDKNITNYLNQSIPRVIGEIESRPYTYNYANGLCGILTAFCLINKTLEIPLEVTYDTDNQMFSTFKKSLKPNNYEFLFGGLGYMFYFLNRPDDVAVPFLEEMINDLLAFRNKNGHGIFWKSYHRVTFDKSYVNLGLAHGMAAIVGIMAETYFKYPNFWHAKRIVEQIYQFYLSNENHTSKNTSLFAYGISSKNRIDKNCRLAWCYGDAGIGITFLISGNKIGNTEVYEFGKEILLHSAIRRDVSDSQVDDPYFCHGSAGLAIIFLNAYKLTKDKRFEETAFYWLNTTLRFLKEKKYSRTGFLTGLSGVGLVLLSFLKNDHLQWEKLMLLK
ncbi:lanthionine synthetase LanC family protein [Sunxiuqinia dokdonensis]|uniref:Lantibiotic biosynthesis protein n=1 Tax=Sunxiuqinia dokdonensis TaxID=1409788 RepID=A0A0L8V4H6_9BACT|nr:lanthionine synthetase LanC family protein [Sunxiuqinia dokdonensis]KOH43329.1 hypothetical protein NC99_38890 [Sunxiuqinia dokdonensis]